LHEYDHLEGILISDKGIKKIPKFDPDDHEGLMKFRRENAHELISM